MVHGFIEKDVQVGGSTRRYVVYVPRTYREDTPNATIVFLHGRGESGSDGLFQLFNGLPPAILRKRDEWPFLVVAPQKPEFDKLWPTERETVNAILRDVEKAYTVHPHQRYLTGLSQGGHGTIALAKRLVWDFAAIAPVCGWSEGPTAAAKDLADMPLWAFHGEKDQAVKPEGSKDLVAALEKLGAHPKLTLYPELGHNCWDAAYRDAGLAEWFLSHTL